MNLDRNFMVPGSPKFNFYKLDFGWANPRRSVFVSIDKTGAISICGGRDCNRDVEVGLSLLRVLEKCRIFSSVFGFLYMSNSKYIVSERIGLCKFHCKIL